jgi:hypothetical protein
VQRDEQVEALGLADLANDNSRGPHAQRLLDEPTQWHLTRALKRRLATLHRDTSRMGIGSSNTASRPAVAGAWDYQHLLHSGVPLKQTSHRSWTTAVLTCQ